MAFSSRKRVLLNSIFEVPGGAGAGGGSPGEGGFKEEVRSYDFFW